MAMNINHSNIAFGMHAPTFVPVKSMDARSESDKKKVALGDIKNAPFAPSTNGGKTETKKVDTEEMTEIDDDYEYASSRPVDWFEAWIEKRVLPEELINKMARLLNGSYIDPDEVIEPPKWVEYPEDIYSSSSEDKWDKEWPEVVELPPTLPDLNSSENHSFVGDIEEDIEEDIKPSTASFFNDSEMSALNLSVFEFTLNSEDDEDD